MHWITCLAHKPATTDAIWIPMHGGGAHPISYHASAIRPYAFLAAQRLTHVLWVLTRKHFPFCSRPWTGERGAVSTPHIDETSSEACFDLLLLPVFNVRKKQSAPLQDCNKISLGASLPVKYATASLAFNSISAITKVKTRSHLHWLTPPMKLESAFGCCGCQLGDGT